MICDSNAPIAVIGHGSWATAIVKILTENKNIVNWYVRNDEVRDVLASEGKNPRYLSNAHFCMTTINLFDNVNDAVAASEIVILATPSAFLEGVMEGLTVSLESKFVISAVKGIIPNGYLTIAEYINQRFNLPFNQIGIISGPCHAEEVALERLSYLTMVCKNIDDAIAIGARFASKYIKISTSTDIYGTEYAAVLKNVYAIAVGICHSLGYGDNFMAVLISNASMEMEDFMNATYAFDRRIGKSVYMGDLLVTCYSQFSRNRTFGMMVGKGYSVKNAHMEMNMVAEGYYAAACIKKILEKYQKEVDMPIVGAVYAILYEGRSAKNQIRLILDKLV